MNKYLLLFTPLRSFTKLAVTLCFFVSIVNVHAQGTWTQVATDAPDKNEGVMLLLPDGSVMVKTYAGPRNSSAIGSGWNRLFPDIHGSYVNGSWYIASEMNDSRLYFSSQVLKNGKIYVAGGEYGTGRNRGEIYDPAQDVWTYTNPIPTLTDTFSDANSKMLPDGRVLQAVVLSGNTLSKHIYIYNPVTNSFTAGPPTLGYDDETSWLILPDSSIFFADVYGGTSERYIPSQNRWIKDADVPVNLYDKYGYETGGGTLLPDGRAFFIGSTNTTAYYTPSGTTAQGTWAAGPIIPDSLGAPDAALAMMPNGKILCALSHTPVQDSVFFTKMRLYEFDYLTNTFTKVGSPEGGDSINVPCYQGNMLCLPDGSVLFSRQGSNEYYIYQPDGSPLASGKPTVDSVFGLCDTFLVTGKLFNGISEGAAYGDDWQMSTNYPLVRISRNDTVFYARTFNWNSTGVQRGNKPDSVQFIMPFGTAHGEYKLQIVANGIASDPVDMSYCYKTGIDMLSKAKPEMNIFPNPASTMVTVQYNNPANNRYNILLTDMYGRILMQQEQNNGNTATLSLSTIAPGIYTISLYDGVQKMNRKLVVK